MVSLLPHNNHIYILILWQFYGTIVCEALASYIDTFLHQPAEGSVYKLL